MAQAANHQDYLQPDYLLPITEPESHWRGWLILLLNAIAMSLGIGLALLFLVAATAATASAESTQSTKPTNAVQRSVRVQTGAEAIHPNLRDLPRGAAIAQGAALLFQTDAGAIAAPLQSTRVDMRVSGHVVRTRVAQTYFNPSDRWMDAVYRFPMPDGSAVDGMVMKIGETVIRGEIKAREVAKRTFEKARAQGKRASLVSQSKPNDFNARVANIGPNGTIAIEIEYQQVLALGPDGWTLRFPTVVAPRFQPDMPRPTPSHELTRVGYEQNSDDLANDRQQTNESPNAEARETKPVSSTTGFDDKEQGLTPTLTTRDNRQNRIEINIAIDAGIPVTIPRSLTHRIDVQSIDEAAGIYQVSLKLADIANRDFELQWEPQPGAQPMASVQFEQFDGQWYGLAVVAPPDPTKAVPLHQPREVVFIIDTSGSMHGGSLEQAVDALHAGLRRLNPKDRFNIIRFSSDHEALYSESKLADPSNLSTARHFLDGLQADGGTQMHGAIERALLPGIPAGFISQVVFVTDGAVGSEQKLFNMIESMLGKRRLFTVGIGTAPNDYFMRKAAAAGRGSFTTIGSVRQVQQRMTRLFEQLAYPMLTDLKLRTENGEVIKTDSPIRDLYAGEPIIHSFRVNNKPNALFLEGVHDRSPWQQEIRVSDSVDSGIHRLWARETLAGFAARIRAPSITAGQRGELRSGATSLALKHGLVSRYTSLIAVDHTPARPANAESQQTRVPRHLPKGWSAKHVLGKTQGGNLAQGSTGVWIQLLFGGLLLLLAVSFGAAFLTRAARLIEPGKN